MDKNLFYYETDHKNEPLIKYRKHFIAYTRLNIIYFKRRKGGRFLI